MTPGERLIDALVRRGRAARLPLLVAAALGLLAVWAALVALVVFSGFFRLLGWGF